MFDHPIKDKKTIMSNLKKVIGNGEGAVKNDKQVHLDCFNINVHLCTHIGGVIAQEENQNALYYTCVYISLLSS
jgi:hypothetical protein